MFKRKKVQVSLDGVVIEPLASESEGNHTSWNETKAKQSYDRRVRELEAAIKAHRDIALQVYDHSPKGTVELIPRHVHETLWSVVND